MNTTKAPPKTLDQLQPGQIAAVTVLHSTSLNRRRLLDLGILPGTTITVEMRSPLGDPTAYRVRGSVVALRREQSREIEITLQAQPTEGE
jgi:Fe2+ transport system protein FeoA